MISASDLAAWDFCPRQVYFRRVLGIKPEKKEVMIKGTVKHKIFETLISRYKKTGRIDVKNTIEKVLSEYIKDFEAFGTDMDKFRKDTEWSFGILKNMITSDEFIIPEFCEEWLESEDLGLKARVDAIFDDSGEWIVGDLKTRISDFLGPKLQIGAGALLFEESKNVKVNKIKIISHTDWDELKIPLTEALRKQVLETRDEIEVMLESKELPPMCSNSHKCAKCDFLDRCTKLNEDLEEEDNEESQSKKKPSLLKRIFG